MLGTFHNSKNLFTHVFTFCPSRMNLGYISLITRLHCTVTYWHQSLEFFETPSQAYYVYFFLNKGRDKLKSMIPCAWTMTACRSIAALFCNAHITSRAEWPLGSWGDVEQHQGHASAGVDAIQLLMGFSSLSAAASASACLQQPFCRRKRRKPTFHCTHCLKSLQLEMAF